MVSSVTQSEIPNTNTTPDPVTPPYRPTLGAFWNLLLYILLLAGLWGAQQVLFFVPATHPTPPSATYTALTPPQTNDLPLTPYTIIEAIDFIAIFMVSLLMATLESRNIGVFGLGGRQPFARFLHGALWGLIAMSILIATLRGLHLLVFDTRVLHGTSILAAGASQLLLFLLVGLFEEYLFRGYIQFTLTRGLLFLGNRLSQRHARTIAFWIAALLTSAIFLYAHTRNTGEDWLGLIQIFLAGIVFVFALWRTGSLWWGIGFHMAWDWSQSFLYGVPDSGGLMQGRLFATHALGKPLLSGGTVGPEGSILCIPVFLLTIAILCFTHSSPQPQLDADS